jgi:hypothetical protein
MSLLRRTREQEYDAARAELGGAPWREVPKSTDAWYILDEEAAAMGAPFERGRRRGLIVGVVVAVGVALLATVALATRAPHAPLPVAAVAAPAVAAPAVAVPAVAAPAVAAPAPVAVAAPAPARASHPAHAKHHASKHTRR